MRGFIAMTKIGLTRGHTRGPLDMCSHLQKKLFEPDGEYYQIWQTIQSDDTLSAVVRSRQLHLYRNGKKVLVLAGKSQPKIIREDIIQKQLLNK
jgi:hypothetical protein